ncbi:hypothetical protein CVT25_004727 [Psilocybe cyanescens]|uniref:Uncharacterized protein n=1 Tax=Psilocybe cyanescens TaxID=93625 RepID=A0A409XRR6_PSICY|nr:hypothetical protein CVT25_004727 [Psilocybe cyanescens]
MAEEAWDSVTAETIQHCWYHTQTQPSADSKNDSPFSDPGAWEILRQFASTDMALPVAKEKLMTYLGNHYNDKDWRPALKAVMDAEGDVVKAQELLRKFSEICERPKLIIKLPARPPQAVAIEENLLKSVETLKSRNRVFGPLPSIEDIVNSAEESQEAEDSLFAFPGGDHEIIDQVVYEGQVNGGGICEDEDSDDEEAQDPDAALTRRNVIELTERLERLTLRWGPNAPLTLGLTRHLQDFRGFLHREESLNAKQTTGCSDRWQRYLAEEHNDHDISSFPKLLLGLSNPTSRPLSH